MRIFLSKWANNIFSYDFVFSVRANPLIKHVGEGQDGENIYNGVKIITNFEGLNTSKMSYGNSVY